MVRVVDRCHPLALTINDHMDVNRLQKLAGAVRTGGKGSGRRFDLIYSRFVSKRFLFIPVFPKEKKVAHKTTSTDDKRLQSVLKRLGVTTVPGIEEVNIFSNDTVTHFTSPKGIIPPFHSTTEKLKLCSSSCNTSKHLRNQWPTSN